jgi:CheY-like chemotaxis protein
MTDEKRVSEDFVAELRRALQHLYDPAELSASRLLGLLQARGPRGNPAAALRAALTNAIRALEPYVDVPIDSGAWRVYHVLLWRYVEQTKQADVASNLAISPRQLRRLEWDAIRVLAHHLWSSHEPLRRAFAGSGDGTSLEMAEKAATRSEMPDREQEIRWLRESLPSETGDMRTLIGAAIQTVAPLAEAAGTRVASTVATNLSPVVGQLAALRQSIISLLAAAIHAVPGGDVRIDAGMEADAIRADVRATGGAALAVSGDEVAEHLEMARRFVETFPGELRMLSTVGDAQPFGARLVLQVPQQTTVLAIDDNADTLRLVRRYLSGTRYRFVGTRDPEEALALAEEAAPQAILLDIMMPGIDGWELLGRLRSHPNLRDVPVLVCTILPQEKLAMALGAAAFVRKPFNREVLLAALKAQMDSRKPG